MIKSFVNISILNDLSSDIKKSLEELARKTVCIGIPEEENTVREGGDITNAQLLYIQTHGVRDLEMRKAMQKDLDGGMPYSEAHELYIHEYGSPLYNVPPRPVLIPALEDNKEVLAELMIDAAILALNGGDVSRGLDYVGQEGQNSAQRWFVDPKNNWAPNSQKTVEGKGSERPLISSGELRQKITYVIKEGG